MFGGLRRSEFIRRLGKPAAIAGVAIAIFSGPIQAQLPVVEGALTPPKPFDLIKAGAQIMKTREENLDALKGDPDELTSSGAPILDLRNQIVQPWDIDDDSQDWLQIPDFGVLEAEGAQVDDQDDTQASAEVDPADLVGEPTISLPVADDGAGAPVGDTTGEHRVEAEELDSVAEMAESLREQWRERELKRERLRAPEADTHASEPAPERARATMAAQPSVTEPRLVPPMPRMPVVAPVAPRKLGAMPAGPPKRLVAPAPVPPVPLAPPVPPVPLVAPKPEVAAAPEPLVEPELEVSSPPVPTAEPERGSAPVPEVDDAPEPAPAELAIPLIMTPESEPNPDAAPKRAYRPWLTDETESVPVDHEPER